MINRYRKGVRFEREIVNEARKEGKIAFRSAGSHSPIDVCVIDTKMRTIRFIQCKTGRVSSNMIETLRSDLGIWDDEFLVSFEVLAK